VQIGEGDDAVPVGSAVEEREKAVFATRDQGNHVEALGRRHLDQPVRVLLEKL
jgi:hypothetical protein